MPPAVIKFDCDVHLIDIGKSKSDPAVVHIKYFKNIKLLIITAELWVFGLHKLAGRVMIRSGMVLI